MPQPLLHSRGSPYLLSRDLERVFGDKGRQLVAENIEHVINFYISQSEAENHAVREAVCACITELVLKIDKAALQPHVSTLLDVLFLCFDDDRFVSQIQHEAHTGTVIFCL